jgi:hypothetical protein
MDVGRTAAARVYQVACGVRVALLSAAPASDVVPAQSGVMPVDMAAASSCGSRLSNLRFRH